MTFDLQKMIESKQALRKKLAALPIAEKLRLLDAMRRREVTIRPSKPPESFAAKEQPPAYDKR